MSSDLRNKMVQWEAQPPEALWNKIVASLDTDDEYVLAQKLSAFESQPPRHAWDAIEAGLDAHRPVRAISFYKKLKLAFQYSGAAAALIFAIVLINLFVSKPSVSNELTQQSNTHHLTHPRNRTSPGNNDVGVQRNGIADSQANSEQDSGDAVAGTSTIPGAAAKHSSKYSYKPAKGSGNKALISWEQAKDSLVNRYFVHMNNRGEAIRFSSKLYDLFECSNDWTESECAQQIKLWQRKAATSAIYASADFTGVLEILKGMEEGNGQ